ncbi:RES domain-containing protein [Runella sp.]|uniref:RES domain-containing protein n=1 Tax=Runella sp. TaxID=1960881 RepID=UPI0030198F2B
MKFPQIPIYKEYGKNDFTPEQLALQEALDKVEVSKKNEKILRECRDFYLKSYKFLKNINLSKITLNEAEAIIKFLEKIFNFHGIIWNDIHFKYVYRITVVNDIFLEDDKVRNSNFLGHPPLDKIKDIGVYNRANTPNSTVLYCSFHPNIALLEIKPKVGQRIIITEWYKESEKPFNSYPILKKDTDINEGLVRASKAFDKTMAQENHYLRSILNQYFQFIGSEFVKDTPIVSPKKFEYLYSAYFADKVLENKFAVGDPTPHYDCIIYPSIAATHLTDNLAIHPESAKKLKPVFMEDCIVVNTRYDHFDLTSGKSVIDRQVLRSAEVIDDGKIIWSDD